MPQKKSWIPPFMYIPNVVHCQCFENSLNCLLRFVWVPNTSTQKQEKMWKSPKLITLHTGFHIHPTYGPRSANEVTSTHGTHDLMSTFCLYFWNDAQMYPKWSLLKIQIVKPSHLLCNNTIQLDLQVRSGHSSTRGGELPQMCKSMNLNASSSQWSRRGTAKQIPMSWRPSLFFWYLFFRKLVKYENHTFYSTTNSPS